MRRSSRPSDRRSPSSSPHEPLPWGDHVGPDAPVEPIRIVRPGGRIAIGVNAACVATAGVVAALDRLVRSGRTGELRLLDVPIYDGGDMSDLDDVAHVAICTVADPSGRG